MISVKEFVYLLLIYSMICFLFFFWLQLFCLFIMASRWQTSAYNNRRKGWRGSLFEKKANEVSAANNIGRLPKTLDAVQ